jgi:hypothetical protein
LQLRTLVDNTQNGHLGNVCLNVNEGLQAKGGSHEISRMSRTDAYSGRENFISIQVEKYTANTYGYSFYAYRKSLMSASVTRHSWENNKLNVQHSEKSWVSLVSFSQPITSFTVALYSCRLLWQSRQKGKKGHWIRRLTRPPFFSPAKFQSAHFSLA